jgi:hypothetical protein
MNLEPILQNDVARRSEVREGTWAFVFFQKSLRVLRCFARLCLFLSAPASILIPSLAQEAKPASLPVAELKHETSVDFEKEILPALKSNCLACHNTTKAKGGLNLETPQLMLKGGDTGPAVAPGKGAESLVFKAAAHLDPELIMPPKDNKANASELTPGNPRRLALDRSGRQGRSAAAAPVSWLDKPPPRSHLRCRAHQGRTPAARAATASTCITFRPAGSSPAWLM